MLHEEISEGIATRTANNMAERKAQMPIKCERRELLLQQIAGC